MVKEIIRYPAENVRIGIISEELICQSRSINTPSLSSCPGRTVPVPLMGYPLYRSSCFRIKKERVIGGVVRTDDILHRRFDMRLCLLCIFLIAGHLGRPEQQGHIQKAVNDQPIIILRAELTPRLNELTLLLETAQQVVCSHQGRFLSRLISGEFPGCHTGRTVKETHIVMINAIFLPDSSVEVLHLNLCGLFQLLVSCFLPREPHLARPEAGCPFIIDVGLIKIVHTGGRWKFFREFIRRLQYQLRRLVICFGKAFPLFFVHSLSFSLTIFLIFLL